MSDSDDSFRGLMKALNLDESQFKSYDEDFLKLSFSQLSTIKQDIELQLSTLFDLLKNKYRVEMDTPLVSPDGFPRADVDVVSIRLVRIKIIRLRNDHKRLLEQLETKMFEEFAKAKQAAPAEEVNSKAENHPAVSPVDSAPPTRIPFAVVSEVVPQGPAHSAGLQSQDKIVLFDGEIHAGNHEKLSALANRVRNKVDREITVEVLRGTDTETLVLVPTNNWEGQGLLGCRLVPL
ncbi:regulatory subunit of putative 26S proteasome non-ATPase [Suhomyces tanzawaensis NRRL Y-17324]|uniref:Probable 26S proteasome regulatory subunit p27 n=1 Tax=Suhomyces tanzawaensis NRRL Y-17324 TaxID=984487 RepID=A0A1E4SPI8_9ASCO|nr:regulatory subunit of putative 26S proteasome non-ATPase [Suhomyces tanzawaensis NRRL Y-17324]ODV81337.1 regulatory subunit of putative 26S proteasome non-ATPase [Suhomyces tanzawaensis NRRL Y-17324]